nr:hypothetical protein [Cellulosimicrobium sp. MM]
MSMPSIASIQRSWERLRPIARSVADSRRRSMTESESVFATPMSAMTTATASSPTMTPRIVSMTLCIAARSTAIPATSTGVSDSTTASWIAGTTCAAAPVSSRPTHSRDMRLVGSTARASSTVRSPPEPMPPVRTTTSSVSPVGPVSSAVSPSARP